MAAASLGGLDVVVRFIGDASSITSEASKVEGTGNRLKSWAKGVGAAIGTAFAVDQMKVWIGAAEESEAVSARLARVFKNAGDATGAWAKHAEDLATTLMNKTGIDDEQIKSAQALLVTFKGVAETAGTQGGAFDRATQAALDLSKTGFGSTDAAAKALGKALQDPEKGLGALKKAGVQFSDAQKYGIATMLASGDQAGALNVILGQVESKVGGVAEKTATSGDKMRASWQETQESLGKALLPVLKQLAPPLQKIATFVQDNATWLVPLAAAIALVVGAIKLWSIAQLVLNAALWTSPITWIILGIVALIAVIVLIVTHFDDLKAAAVAAFDWIKQAASDVWTWIQDHWPLILAILLGPITTAAYFIATHWDEIKQGASDLIDAIGRFFAKVVAAIVAPFAAAFDWVKGAFNDVVAFAQSIPGRIASAVSTVGAVLAAPFLWAWGQIQNIAGSISGAFNTAIGFVKGVWNGFARGWNGITIHIPSVHIPVIGDVGGGSVSLPNLPLLAQGGIVTRATLAILGESGPEAVVPLSSMPSSGSTYNINVNVDAGASPAAVGAAIVDQIRQYERVAGKRWRTA